MASVPSPVLVNPPLPLSGPPSTSRPLSAWMMFAPEPLKTMLWVRARVPGPLKSSVALLIVTKPLVPRPPEPLKPRLPGPAA